MVLSGLASNIPNPFGGFSPFPNSIMIPFMQAQSSALAYGFGIDYEYGKRTIKSMSNEQFNALTPDAVNSLIKARTDAILSQLQADLPQYTAFMSEIIDKQVEIEVAKANRTPSAMAEVVNALLAGGHQATSDAISTYVTNEEDKNVALQTLSLISPLFALMGLSNATGGGGTTTPVPQSYWLGTWGKLASKLSAPYPIVRNDPYQYQWDSTKKQELLDAKASQLNTLADKISTESENGTNMWNYTWSIGNYFPTNKISVVTDMIEWIKIFDEWQIINGTPENLSHNPDQTYWNSTLP